MSRKQPLFSIVLPTRDRPQLVGTVLKYLQQQQFTDFEVIVSDNAVNADCWQQVAPYLSDSRFHYIKPSQSLDMCSHWDFAISAATGRYISIFCEKFILRPDALQLMSEEIEYSTPDILTWQFEMFDVLESTDADYFGNYHPLIKPGEPFSYQPENELVRRFNFDYPLFCRWNKSKDSYGKIYSGFVVASLIKRVKDEFGRVFNPLSPDFTSMLAFLNCSRKCVDINQPLMLVINQQGASNGEATKHSLTAMQNFVASYGLDFNHYCQQLPIAGFGLGHNVTIAAELIFMKQLATEGVLKSVELDIPALAFWARLDIEDVTDWGGEDKSVYEALLTPWLEQLSEQRKATLLINQQQRLQPAINEIYHSGLDKIAEFTSDISAVTLAECHWLEGKAPPRKPVSSDLMSLAEAMTYFTVYQQESCRLLGLNQGVL